MSKNIILLSDGTGNSNIKDRGTNVFKLYEAIDFNLPDCQQVAFYDDGVGTQEFKPLKILGGAFGWGLSRNVRHLYKELVRTYEPGDKIYLFGFSRGAFTVRRLAGFICEMGILDKTAYLDEQLDNAVWHSFRRYRAKNPALLEPLYDPVIKLVFENGIHKLADKELKLCDAKPSIEFIGAWDTVAAVGLPFDWATDILDSLIFRFKFKDHDLHKRVHKAYHAISVDDERQSFSPLLWNDNPRIEQAWFAGVHSNVGGGYPQQGLSLVALEWMMAKAKTQPEDKNSGLRFVSTDMAFVKDKKYRFDKLYNSRSGFGTYYRYKPRDFTEVCNDKIKQVFIPTPQIHISVFERISQGVFGYAPGNIPNTFEVVNDQGTHPQSKAIAELVNHAAGNMQSATLLGQAKTPIMARRILHFVLVIYSLITLYWLIRGDLQASDMTLLDILKMLVSPDSLLENIGLLFRDHPIFIVVGIIIFGCTVKVRQITEHIFSQFWSKLRPNLQKLLQEENKTG
ncbi:conserved hypothetical protein [Crenothrix polyspora]|uniref:T6SS Phospholipase effector Tle1-like catalytic domain-containing protein n=1 Tax=Crenothrix polyspora TaxID=360316 RepID=A0A1R4H5J2_9GAMM|nr:DUF2235 domain-containing protein [Crenothrix polyspora]SJM91514.1 conserved hypothetical protein [Crenothrix polyspora]